MKYKESKIVKKCLRCINLQVVSRDKCNNGIKRENSTGNLSIINRTIAGPKRESIPFSGMIKLKLEPFKSIQNKITKKYLQGVDAILGNGCACMHVCMYKFI